MTPAPDRLLAGQVGKPHGLRGEVYVIRISDDPHRFDPGSRLFRESGEALVVESIREHQQRLLVKFEGADSREDAESLQGALYVEPGDLRELGEEEYWEHDLVGLDVLDTNGTRRGRVTGLIPGAQDLLAVDTDSGERLIPFVEAIVVAVDVDAGTVTVDPPEGLLD